MTDNKTNDAVCHDYRPDHNGECLNCDEPAEEHALALLEKVASLQLSLSAAEDVIREQTELIEKLRLENLGFHR